MSWEMAPARLVISSGVQILWVIARVQEGKTLLGYQIVAIFCLKEEGGKKEKHQQKSQSLFCEVYHHCNAADMSIRSDAWGQGRAGTTVLKHSRY